MSIPLGGLFDPTQLAAKAQIPGAALEARAAGSRAPGARCSRLAGVAAIAACAHCRQAAGAFSTLRSLDQQSQTSGRIDRAHHSAGWDPGRQCFARAEPHTPRAGTPTAGHRRVLAFGPRKLASDGSTQEDLITIRGERFVIPVRAELKRRISGVVHGASSSGQTVYVEPLETIEQNNELVRLLGRRAGGDSSDLCGAYAAGGNYAEGSSKARAYLPSWIACWPRARFARDYDCVAPAITPQTLHLDAARHPLLEKRLRSGAQQPESCRSRSN